MSCDAAVVTIRLVIVIPFPYRVALEDVSGMLDSESELALEEEVVAMA